MKSKRNCYLIPTENIPLVQEMAYVRHKQEIVAYLQQIKMNEEKEFNDLKASFIQHIIIILFVKR